MTENENKTTLSAKTDEQALQDFLLDIECLDKLSQWTDKFNLFDVLKISRVEIRHSNMLAWLLDPNENHGLGDTYLRGVLQALAANSEKETENRYDVFKFMLMDLYGFSVHREWRSIDILLVSEAEKVVIAIENKIGAHEHDDQLNRYRKIIETEYKGYQAALIYLTPDGESPSDDSHWDILTYEDIVNVLERVSEKKELLDDVRLIIKNYIDVIRRDIVEDQELRKICIEIDKKHKRALDLIYRYRPDEIRSTLEALNKEGKIIHDSSWSKYTFRTPEMDTVLPLLEEENSSWRTSNIYSYWLKVDEDRICGIFELGGYNVPTQQMIVMQKIIDELKPDDKRKQFKYKRVFRTKWKSLVDDPEAAVRFVVDELIAKEKELLSKIQ